ncbi:hypothetical protein [Paenarthrobacter ureafaciens]|uniref:hypothetical protein n=1 Tax=Paenarthrobacter ureafaciens TaxID=37931 RepID=UPI00140CA767|nr:hypothetical protein [Paenarthrobacter ureafaciens]MCX8453355.1 hypothetical protein [Paenarthrobacter ureafaciens]MCY0972936.1 hypothetical protein [Paenarthrobacter ureafaciens]UOD81988.1 hypothetical protein MQZ73_03620 [Paenarthrobacter ureafaciens]WNZ05480.1 hypothetical protein PVT25_08160 [Paenarthrobacter ureafaciens]
MISKKITIDVARFDRSTRGSVTYDPSELDRVHAWDISRLPQGSILEILVHGYRPFRFPGEYGGRERFPDPHAWARPDFNLIITADSNEIATEWEALFLDHFRNYQQHKPAA